MNDSDSEETMDAIPQLEIHPFALMFPAMEAGSNEFITLRDNIQIHGLLHPIVLFQHRILDGRNRYAACIEEQRPIKTINFDGDETAAFHYVLNTNMYRRHLTESQRAMCVWDVRQNITDSPRVNDPSFTQERLAEKFNVSPRMVSHVFKLMKSKNAKELSARVRSGDWAIDLAAKYADAPDEFLVRALAGDAKNARAITQEIKRQERLTKVSNKAFEQTEQLGGKFCNVIYSDPPWKFEVYSETTGMDRSADNHYDTMDFGKLLDLQIPAADDCVMFMWVTVPHLAQGIELLAHWGFEYKSAWFWDKQVEGTGYWFRNQVEMILVGTKGNIAAPTPGEQPPQLISEAKTTHSTKPDVFAEWIAKIYPNMPKLEMFARKPRHGWDTWGNEVGYVHDVTIPDFVQERLDSIDEVVKSKRSRRKKQAE